MATAVQFQDQTLSDEEIAERVLGGETALYEMLMRRYNQRLYRVAYSILRDPAEAEDVMQDAYVRAYEHLGQFAGRARFSTWLTRIAVHEALARAEKRKRLEPFDEHAPLGEDLESCERSGGRTASPEEEVAQMEIRNLLEQMILDLPESYRVIFTLRAIEQASTAEAAETLGLSEENVKVRLHRARSLMREKILSRLGESAPQLFPFMGARCDNMVARVLAQISRS
ncbi:MAG: RNA polymerase sigma factor [Acidobacteriaceae bacterium]